MFKQLKIYPVYTWDWFPKAKSSHHTLAEVKTKVSSAKIFNFDSDDEDSSNSEEEKFSMHQIKYSIAGIELNLDKETSKLMAIIQKDEIFEIANEIYK